MQLPGDLGDGTVAEKNFFGGLTFESDIITRRMFFRHGRLRGARGILA